MMILEQKQDCCGCHACFNACPVQAIQMEYDEEGFVYPAVDEDICIHCNKCKTVCPALTPPQKGASVECWACQAADQDERLSSSSGGAFAVLARAVLQEGGVVCGAAYEENLSVSHIIVTQEDDLCRLKGSKYVQSTVGGAYSELLKHLKAGKMVLFSGTPCQVAGLKAYLGQEYENLLTMDIICHGVPSPIVWREYLSLLGEVDSINLRHKDAATGTEAVRVCFTNGTEITEEKQQNPYLRGFLQNLYLRPSCFACKFKGVDRCSDITVGDFWGVKEYHPDMADGFGTSSLIVHSWKGQLWLGKAQGGLRLKQATAEEIATWNACLLKPVVPTEKRGAFYARWHQEPFISLIEELARQSAQATAKPNLLSKVKRKIRHLLSKEANHGK